MGKLKLGLAAMRAPKTPGSLRNMTRVALGFAMVSGLLLSQVLTLYTTPVIDLSTGLAHLQPQIPDAAIGH